jgi:hypothetical protein
VDKEDKAPVSQPEKLDKIDKVDKPEKVMQSGKPEQLSHSSSTRALVKEERSSTESSTIHRSDSQMVKFTEDTAASRDSEKEEDKSLRRSGSKVLSRSDSKSLKKSGSRVLNRSNSRPTMAAEMVRLPSSSKLGYKGRAESKAAVERKKKPQKPRVPDTLGPDLEGFAAIMSYLDPKCNLFCVLT